MTSLATTITETLKTVRDTCASKNLAELDEACAGDVLEGFLQVFGQTVSRTKAEGPSPKPPAKVPTVATGTTPETGIINKKARNLRQPRYTGHRCTETCAATFDTEVSRGRQKIAAYRSS